MNRRRLISILSAMSLSLAALTGPAFALDELEDPLDEDGIHLETELAEAKLDTSESEAKVEVAEESVSVEDGEVDTTLDDGDDGDGGGEDDDGGSVSDPVTDLVGGGDDDSPPADDEEEGGGSGGDVKTAGDGTVAAPPPTTPYRADYGITRSGPSVTAGYDHGYAAQRPAPASSVSEPEVAEPAELAPEVAPPRPEDGTEVVNLASTPITDPAQAPNALKIVAALLVAGTALSWWNAREVVAETSR